MKPVRIISTIQSTEVDPHLTLHQEMKGEAALYVSNTSQFNWVYDDSGTGSQMDLTVFRPAPTDPSVFIIGDAAFQTSVAQGFALTVKAINDDGKNPLLMPPTTWRQIWDDHGTGGSHDGSLWEAVPPDGYVAIGCVANCGYDAPSIPNYRCLRHDLVTTTTAGAQIWSDQGSGGSKDVSIYKIEGVDDAFLLQPNYNPPTGTYYKIKQPS